MDIWLRLYVGEVEVSDDGTRIEKPEYVELGQISLMAPASQINIMIQPHLHDLLSEAIECINEKLKREKLSG